MSPPHQRRCRRGWAPGGDPRTAGKRLPQEEVRRRRPLSLSGFPVLDGWPQGSLRLCADIQVASAFWASGRQVCLIPCFGRRSINRCDVCLLRQSVRAGARLILLVSTTSGVSVRRRSPSAWISEQFQGAEALADLQWMSSMNRDWIKLSGLSNRDWSFCYRHITQTVLTDHNDILVLNSSETTSRIDLLQESAKGLGKSSQRSSAGTSKWPGPKELLPGLRAWEVRGKKHKRGGVSSFKEQILPSNHLGTKSSNVPPLHPPVPQEESRGLSF